MTLRNPTIKALGEIALRVNDLEKMEKFYHEVVGLDIMKRFENVVFFCIAESYGGHTQTLALFDRSKELRGPRIHNETPTGVSCDRSTLDHLAFAIDLSDYESERARLESLGLDVETVEFGWTSWRSLYVADPEGNTVEFVCFDSSIKK